MTKINVVQWGIGAMGSGMLKLMLSKPQFNIVGAIDYRKELVGKDIGDICNIAKTNIFISDNAENVLKNTKVDVCILAINSFTKECFLQMKTILELGVNLVTIAEEMAYPEAQQPELAKELDLIAKKHGVSAIGTGINPGFILDAQVIMLSAACLNVKHIEASRINDLSPFGPTVMQTQGVGTTPEEFYKGIKSGEIVGHIGFPESIMLISDALGLGVNKIEEHRKPIISNVYRETPHVKVEAGMVAGCEHIGIGYKNGEEIIKLIHPQQIHPHLENVKTGDYINIYGDPDIHMANSPEIPGGKGTMAVAVNIIPHLVKASPGLKRMIDLPIPSCLMGDSAFYRRV